MPILEYHGDYKKIVPKDDQLSGYTSHLAHIWKERALKAHRGDLGFIIDPKAYRIAFLNEFTMQSQKDALKKLFSDVDGFTTRYGFDRYRHLLGGDYFELCFNIPNPPMGWSASRQERFMDVAIKAIYNTIFEEYGKGGEYLPGVYMRPRFGVKDGIKNQWNISVALSRWMIPQDAKDFSLSLIHETDLSRILNSFYILSNYIEGDTEEVIAKLNKAWTEKCKTVLRRTDFDESIPYVSKGFLGGFAAPICAGFYVDDPYADAYDLLTVVASSWHHMDEHDNKLEESRPSEIKIVRYFPGIDGKIAEERISDALDFERKYLFTKRQHLYFYWEEFGWLKMPCFREMVYLASWVGLREPLKHNRTEGECLIDNSHKYILLEMPLPEIARRAKALQKVYNDGGMEAANEYLQGEYIPLRPVRIEDGVKTDYEEWLLRYYATYLADLIDYIDEYKEINGNLKEWKGLVKLGRLRNSRLEYFDAEKACERLEELTANVNKIVDDAEEYRVATCTINGELLKNTDVSGVKSMAHHKYIRDFDDNNMAVLGLGIPTALPDVTGS